MEKLTIIGAGNLGIAIAKGVVNAGLLEASNVVLTRRNLQHLDALKQEGFQVSDNNLTAIERATFVVLCVQPKQLESVLEEINPALVDQVLVSVITGVSVELIAAKVDSGTAIVRAMPNTAVAIGESMTCICSSNEVSKAVEQQVVQIFESLGEVLVIEERLMKAATVLGASGIAFFMRYLRAATQGGIEMGFHPEEAQQIAVQTAKGAASLIISQGNHPEVEIDRVTTPQGCTIAGLNEMEHQGFSSALIKGLLTSFEKINSISS
ncbi:MAG: pyrroline-5-carboxylate reductase [Cytophagales bacterium]|nr:pyrroline-5-carboxylate reductase [Cytophagales bacterium]